MLAAGVLALLGYCLVRLVLDARPAFTSAGVIGFAVRDDWNPAAPAYHGGALLAGTLITSAIALALGVPIALATALFTSELCPLRFRPVLALLVELLAAVPSVVYGLWGVFVLIPKLRGPSSSGSRTRSPSCRSSAATSPGRATSSPASCSRS